MSRMPHNSAVSKKGSMLLITLVAVFLVTTLSIAVISITMATLDMNNRQQQRAIAFNIAESGAEDALLYLTSQAAPPQGDEAFDPFDGPVSFGGGTYSVTIDPNDEDTGKFLKTYVITSVGRFGNASKTVEIAAKQASFGRYAYFTDREKTVSGSEIWWTAGEVVDGPVHSNNRNNSNFSINYNGSTSPIFLDKVTAAGTSINYNPSKPKNEATFRKIFAEGSKGYQLGVDPIELPETTDVQKEAAWGGSAGFPSSAGVYLRGTSDSGIYIVGDASITLSLDTSGNQKIVITQVVSGITRNTTIILDRYSQTTTASGSLGYGSATGMSSLPNGVIYCTGDITSLQGEIADNLYSDGEITTRSEMTIATDVNNNKDITIKNNLTYHTKPDKTLDQDAEVNLAAGTLGLVARNITISSTAPANLEIDAVCMAGGENTSSGSFSVENYSSKKPTGTLTVLGGIIQKARGPVGTFNSSTGQTVTGYRKNYKYDSRLAQTPPPFYPTTGHYERLSWRVVPN
jgi:hypothetical protein